MLQRLLPLLIFCGVGLPVAAGGLFGDGGLIRGDIGRTLDANPAKPRPVIIENTPKSRSFEETLIEPEPEGSASQQNSRGVVTYQSLRGEKSKEELEYEAWISQNLNVKVSTICVTVSTACSVQLTVTGSTCFCTRDSNVELGMVQ